MGELYHKDAIVFDNMQFELAAQLSYQLAALGNFLGSNLTNDFYNGLIPLEPLIASDLQAGYAVTGEF
ncbi:MAG: hypothetical protein NPIRA02_09950 [Nitrospirales bacterium]|nr:MAG: hypothetical protein NPIRA02_09950 [Nitrospirales bacterium]